MENLQKNCAAVLEYAEQRPGFESANYSGAPEAYRADRRTAERDLGRVRELVRRFGDSPAFDAHLGAVLSGNDRLRYDADGRIEYTVGQYWCTEFRGACAEALRRAAWRYYADGIADASAEQVRKNIRRSLRGGLARFVCN